MRISNIHWDTDGELVEGLPKEEVVEDVAEEEIADYLSDKYGFCVFSFSIEEE